jgi:hypothetical protein
MTIEDESLYLGRGELQRRYGAGTYVAVYDWAIIEWGDKADRVRTRAEILVVKAYSSAKYRQMALTIIETLPT